MYLESNIHQDHVCFKSQEDVCAIARPLLENSPVAFFYYGRNYHDGSAFRLHTDKNYFKTWLENNHAWGPNYLRNGWHMWNDSQPEDQIEIRERYGYGNGIFIINHTEDYTEIFGYAPKAGECLGSFMLNQKDVIERFNLYFKDKAKNLIEEAQNNLLYMPNKKNVPTCKNNVLPKNHKELFTSMPVKTMKFRKDLEVSLSKKELIAFQCVLVGNTAKEIAEKLNVSQKTAETYVYRVKKKFGCKSRSQLISLACELGLVKVSGWIS